MIFSSTIFTLLQDIIKNKKTLRPTWDEGYRGTTQFGQSLAHLFQAHPSPLHETVQQPSGFYVSKPPLVK
jgi:hypothetical protein